MKGSRFSLLLFFLSGALAIVWLAYSFSVATQPTLAKNAVAAKSTAPTATEVLNLINARRYDAAIPGITALAAASPKDMSLQYYLGVCAMGVHNLPWQN